MNRDPASAHREQAALWARHAVLELLELWGRRGEAYGRRLRRLYRVRDPAEDLFVLMARRLLPLPAQVRRELPSERLGELARAFERLERPDRAVLWELGRGSESDRARREHAAAALWRLTRNTQAARRGSGAPPGVPPA